MNETIKERIKTPEVKQDEFVERPKRFRVILVNDDYTPQEFVVWVLMKIFFKSRSDSARIMLKAHNEGKAYIDTYSYDIAKSKVAKVKTLADENGHPLSCELEEEQ